MIETPVVFITTPPWGGKTTILDIIRSAFDGDRNFIAADMSGVIAWHRDNKTREGTEFQKLIDLQRGSKLYPPELVMDATASYLDHFSQRNKIFLGFFGGVPRHPEQTGVILRRFALPKLVHISADIDEIVADLKAKGPRDGRLAPDDEADVRSRFQTEYVEQTFPAVTRFVASRPHDVLYLKRKERMSDKVPKIIRFSDVRSLTMSRWLHRCGDRSHPAGKQISVLDAERHKPVRSAMGSPDHHTPVAMNGTSVSELMTPVTHDQYQTTG